LNSKLFGNIQPHEPLRWLQKLHNKIKKAHIFKVVRDIATKIVKVRQTANTFIVIGDTSADMKLKWRAMVPDY